MEWGGISSRAMDETSSARLIDTGKQYDFKRPVDFYDFFLDPRRADWPLLFGKSFNSNL